MTQDRVELTVQQDAALTKALGKLTREEISQEHFKTVLGLDAGFTGELEPISHIDTEVLMSALYHPSGWIVCPDPITIKVDRKVREDLIEGLKQRNTGSWSQDATFSFQAGFEECLTRLGIELTPAERQRASEAL